MPDPIHDDPQAILSDLAAKLRVVDRHLVGVVRTRLDLALQVGYAKHRQVDADHPHGQPISRPEVEDARISDIRKIAQEMGVSPHLLAGILYDLINESCKTQMIQFQEGGFGYGDVDYESLKQNLVMLANTLAQGYDAHLANYPATRAYLEFEAEVMQEQIDRTPSKQHAVDLGCGVGGVSIRLASHFDRVAAVDMSQGMIAETSARAKALGLEGIECILGDIEDEGEVWSSFQDDSIDFVSMNLGMASCIRSTRLVLGQVDRILRPGGRYLLSFYNSDALLYQWFSPWAKSLTAVIDKDRKCLDVNFEGRMLSVFAQAYGFDEVKDLFTRRLASPTLYSHPTFAAMLPREMLMDDGVAQKIANLDRTHAYEGGGEDGAYIIAVGRKG